MTAIVVPKWGGRRAQAWTRDVLARGGTRCVLRYPRRCTVVATEGDHIVPRSVDLSRQYDVTNGRPACRACNAYRGATLDNPRAVVFVAAFFEAPASSRKECSAVSPPGSTKIAGPRRIEARR